MSILQNIFSDHFHKLLNSNIKIRDTVIENVDKMIHCGDFKRGYAFYICEHCSRFMVSPFRCRSRFCTSCGNLYSRKRSTAMSFKLVRTSHRHCVFTIPEELRIFFRKDRSLLNLLFKAAADAVFFMFKKLNKSENFTPGFICVLHTFGRSLQWNPHIHMLISEGASGNFSVWRVVKHFHYELLRKSFRLTLLNYLEKHFKLIRYYGIYAKHHKHENSLRLFIPKEKRRFHILRNSWRTSVSLSFHFDPLLCKCGHKMTFFQFYLNGTPFFEKSNSWINSS